MNKPETKAKPKIECPRPAFTAYLRYFLNNALADFEENNPGKDLDHFGLLVEIRRTVNTYIDQQSESK